MLESLFFLPTRRFGQLGSTSTRTNSGITESYSFVSLSYCRNPSSVYAMSARLLHIACILPARLQPKITVACARRLHSTIEWFASYFRALSLDSRFSGIFPPSPFSRPSFFIMCCQILALSLPGLPSNRQRSERARRVKMKDSHLSIALSNIKISSKTVAMLNFRSLYRCLDLEGGMAAIIEIQ